MARAPYPGLRPFTRQETDLFFGREQEVDSLVDRLAARRLLVVLGASGSGKSSLVRTGLLDALEMGLLAKAGASWQIADLRPGGTPIANLARALIVSTRAAADEPEIATLAAFLRRGPRAIVEWCRDGHLETGANLLLLVDQFEELFRYDSYETREEAQAFVTLLIESARQRDVPIYVVFTMRSEYLGACALIDGLAETINEGQYLTPRMSRDQCRAAIEGPAGVCGVSLEPALVNEMLNDLSAFAPWDEESSAREEHRAAAQRHRTVNANQLDRLAKRADQLPLMQHVLNRLWTKAAARAGGGPIELRLADYTAAGGLQGSLSAHADEILRDLGKTRKGVEHVAELVFRSLVEGSSIADAVRHPTSIRDLAAIAGDADAVRAMVEAFRAADCSFLIPAPPVPLNDDTPIDISHESLIRQWPRLAEWIHSEIQAAAWWRRLSGAAQMYADGQGNLLRGLELTSILKFSTEFRPNAVWAARHGSEADFTMAMDFLRKSEEADRLETEQRQELERKASDAAAARKRARQMTLFVVATLLVAVGLAAFTAFAIHERQAADAAAKVAEKDRHGAEEELRRAAGLQSRVAESTFEGILEDIAARQREGNWSDSGAILGTLGEFLVVRDGGSPWLPEVLEARLGRPMRRQYLASIAMAGNVGEGRSAALLRRLAPDRPLPSEVHATFGNYAAGGAAIALGGKSQVVVYRSDATGMTWEEEAAIDLGDRVDGRSERPIEVRGLSFIKGGEELAILLGDRLLIGSPRQLAQGTARVVTFDPRSLEAEAGLERAAPVPAEKTVERNWLLQFKPCDEGKGSFVLLDASGRLWYLEAAAPAGSRRWQRLLAGRLVAGSFDAQGGQYAAIASNEAQGRRGENGEDSELVIGSCSPDDPGRPVPTAVGAGVQHIRFVGKGRLGLAKRQSGRIMFVMADDKGISLDRAKIFSLPDGTNFFGFGGEQRVWLSVGDHVLEMWDIERQQVLHSLAVPADAQESAARVPSDVQKPPSRLERTSVVGNAAILMSVGQEEPRISVDIKSQGRDWSPAELSVLNFVRSKAPPKGLAALIDTTKTALRMAGYGTDLALRPDRRQVQCQHPLEQLISAIERAALEDDQQDYESVRNLAQDIERCAASTGSTRHDHLLATLKSNILDGEFPRKQASWALVSAAIAGTAAGDVVSLRLLALLLEQSRSMPNVDGQGGLDNAAMEVSRLALRKGAPIPHSLVSRFANDRQEWLATLAGERIHSDDGRVHDVLGLWHARSAPQQALSHMILAGRLYRAAGDGVSEARLAGQRADFATARATDEIILAAWLQAETIFAEQRRQGAGTTPPGTGTAANAATSDRQAVLAALGAIIDQIATPMAKAELLAFKAGLTGHPAGGSSGGQKGASEAYWQAIAATDALSSNEKEAGAILVFRVAQALRDLGDGAGALKATAHAVALMDSGATLPAKKVRWLTQAMRELASAGSLPEEILRKYLGGLTWRFLHYDWDTRRLVYSRELQSLLSAAVQLQELAARQGIAGRDFQVARAYTHFRLGTIERVDREEQKAAQHFKEAADHLRQVGRERMREPALLVFYAETLLWSAVTDADIPSGTVRQRTEHKVSLLREARDILGAVLAAGRELPSHSYVLAAGISGLSDVLWNLSDAFRSLGQYAFNDGRFEEGVNLAWEALQAEFSYKSLLQDPKWQAVARESEFGKVLCCLAPAERIHAAFIVGMVVGASRLSRSGGPIPGECDRLASHPFDPDRISAGVSATEIKELEYAIRICEGQYDLDPQNVRTAYHLARLLSLRESPADLDRALEKLTEAAVGGYAIAFSNLALRIHKCDLKEVFEKEYLRRVLSEKLPAMISLMTSNDAPGRQDVLDWLQKEAKRIEPARLDEIRQRGSAYILNQCSIK